MANTKQTTKPTKASKIENCNRRISKLIVENNIILAEQNRWEISGWLAWVISLVILFLTQGAGLLVGLLILVLAGVAWGRSHQLMKESLAVEDKILLQLRRLAMLGGERRM